MVIDPDAGAARSVRFAQVRKGDQVVVGHDGARVEPLQRDVRRADAFEFMASEVVGVRVAVFCGTAGVSVDGG